MRNGIALHSTENGVCSANRITASDGVCLDVMVDRTHGADQNWRVECPELFAVQYLQSSAGLCCLLQRLLKKVSMIGQLCFRHNIPCIGLALQLSVHMAKTQTQG